MMPIRHLNPKNFTLAIAAVVIAGGLFAWSRTAPAENKSRAEPGLSAQLAPEESGADDTRSGIDPSTLPDSIHPEQIWDSYRIEGAIYLVILQPNMSHLFPLRDTGWEAEWGGVLVSHDNGDTWEKFLEIKPIPHKDAHNGAGTIIHNPVGIFKEGNTLFIDVADDVGGGSGEGQLNRLASTDGGNTWTRTGCYYYIPEDYHTYNIDYESVDINPNNMQKISGCYYDPSAFK